MNDIERAAWQKRNDPNAHPPRRALEMALAKINDGEINPTHAVVVFLDHDALHYFQAGSESQYGAIGMMTRAAKIMGDPD